MNRRYKCGLLAALLTLSLAGCDNSDRDTRVWRLATRKLVETYADAARTMVRDCGPERVAEAKFPNALFQNPGWDAWRGPYVQGKVRAEDLFGSQIRFVVTNGQMRIISAGEDRRFGTLDDIVESVYLK